MQEIDDVSLSPPLSATGGRAGVPAAARWLGASGLIPFVGLVIAILWGLEPFGRSPTAILMVYGAVILSFMGAIHWGLAMARYGGRQDQTWVYIVSVLPALVGWFAVCFFPYAVALWIIAAAFVALFAYDLRAIAIGGAPPWYAGLRWPLTLVAVVSLMTAALLS